MDALLRPADRAAAARETDAAHLKRLQYEHSADSGSPRKRRRTCQAPRDDTASGSSDDDTVRVPSPRPTELHVYVQRLHVALEHCLVEGLSSEEAMNNLAAEGWHPGAVSVVWARLEAENPEFFSHYNDRQLCSQRQEVAVCHARQVEQLALGTLRSSDDARGDAGAESDTDSKSSSCSGSALH